MSVDAKPASPRSPRAQMRTAGRILALQLCYAWEQKKYVDDGHLVPGDDLAEVAEDAQVFARELYAGVVANRVPVDAAVDQRLENWTIQRLAVPDRNLMRLGAYELLYRPETPTKVAINEYIELAKQFGSEGKTAKLVNGVLDAIARQHRSGDLAKREPPPAPAAPA